MAGNSFIISRKKHTLVSAARPKRHAKCHLHDMMGKKTIIDQRKDHQRPFHHDNKEMAATKVRSPQRKRGGNVASKEVAKERHGSAKQIGSNGTRATQVTFVKKKNSLSAAGIVGCDNELVILKRALSAIL